MWDKEVGAVSHKERENATSGTTPRERLSSLVERLAQRRGQYKAGHKSGGPDRATRWLDSRLERWGIAEPLRRLTNTIQRDVLVRTGEPTPMEARASLYRSEPGLAVDSAYFRLDGRRVTRARIDGTNHYRGNITAPEPGIYRVDVARRSDAPISRHSGLLQVVDDSPVVLVDAAVTNRNTAKKAEVVALFTALSDSSIEFAFVEFGENTRRADLLNILDEFGMPHAAVLTYDVDLARLIQMGAAPGAVIAATAIRRLQTRGVAAHTIVTPNPASLAGLPLDIRALSVDNALLELRGDNLSVSRRAAVEFHRRRASTDALSWRLDLVSGATAIDGNHAHVEFDNRRARERVFDLIDNARHSIDLQFYIVQTGRFTDELVVRLIRRARDGVAIRVMVDALYSEQQVLGRSNPPVDSLHLEAGIEVLALSPIPRPKDLDVSALKQRDHRKLMVFDKERAIVTGRNAGDEYYFGFDEVPIHDNTRHGQIPWFDAHVEVHGPIAARIYESFETTWREHSDTAGQTVAGFVSAPPRQTNEPGALRARLVVHRGLQDINTMACFEAMLDLARERVIIVNDFPIVGTLERAILRALARGVRIDIMTGSAAPRRADGTMFPAPLHRVLFEHMLKARLEPLMKSGASIFEYSTRELPGTVSRGGTIRPYVHAKVMAIDGRAASIGSANLDATASFWENEANVVIDDADFTARLEQTLCELMAASVRLELDSSYWRREKVERGLVEKLWPDWLYS